VKSAEIFFVACIILLLAGVPGHAGNCFVGKNSFAVIQPYLMERSCYLYAHEARTYKPGMESEHVIVLPSSEIHPDPLHVEFLKLVTDKKLLPLNRGTQVFGCDRDLEAIKRAAREPEGGFTDLPEANCRGQVYRLVPVRPVNANTCYWIADADVRCETQTEFQTTPYSLFEEELRFQK
jgi:hypothetical protein